jgi:hypothetical protein
MGKVWTEEQTKNLILTNDEMVKRCTLVLHALNATKGNLHVIQAIQMLTEKMADLKAGRDPIHKYGLSESDAKYVASFTEQMAKTGTLSVKQLAVARNICLKHVTRLNDTANGKIKYKKEE